MRNEGKQDTGSFRDPGGHIYHLVFRLVADRAAADYEYVRDLGLRRTWAERGSVIDAREVDSRSVGAVASSARHVLEHPRLSFICYPYEWPFLASREDVFVDYTEDAFVAAPGRHAPIVRTQTVPTAGQWLVMYERSGPRQPSKGCVNAGTPEGLLTRCSNAGKRIAANLPAPYREPSNAILPVFDEDQRARVQLREALSENCREALIHRIGALIGQSTDDDARLVEDAKSKDVAEVEIERHNDAGIRAGAIDEFGVRGTLQP